MLNSMTEKEKVIEAMRKVGYMVGTKHHDGRVQTGDIWCNIVGEQVLESLYFTPIPKEAKKPDRYVMKKHSSEIAVVVSRPNCGGIDYVVYDRFKVVRDGLYTSGGITGVCNILPKQAFEYIFKESDDK